MSRYQQRRGRNLYNINSHAFVSVITQIFELLIFYHPLFKTNMIKLDACMQYKFRQNKKDDTWQSMYFFFAKGRGLERPLKSFID
jgi:hypothetical protein